MTSSPSGPDRSLLPDADLEFVVIADTHYMRDVGDAPLEFESRRLQTARAGAALREAADLGVATVVHVGDLVQAYPESHDFDQACVEARRQIAEAGLTPFVVVGNHDVGDKPDPTMPTAPVDAARLEAYHAAHGPSWFSFDRGACHFVVLNSQILNQEGRHAAEQQRWAEADLAAADGRRIFLFLHLPPYLHDPEEPGLGHYDNVASPARDWLLRLFRIRRVEMVFAAHVHFAFFDRVNGARCFTVPSTSFARPGFSHLFASGPPPERGRDDTGKLGFYLCRVTAGRTDVHLVRTEGATGDPPPGPARRLVTRTSPALPQSPLGLTLSHPLATVAQVPVAYPSLVRQPVRNDYPLLACVELGARTLRVPEADLSDALQARRLQLLRAEGLRLVATHLWAGPGSLSRLAERHAGRVDGWELQVPGAVLPSPEMLSDAAAVRDRFAPEVSLCPTVPGERLDPVKQHPRTRIGYRPDELPALDRHLACSDGTVDRVLCRLQPHEVWATVERIRQALPANRIASVDVRLELQADPDAGASAVAAEALAAASRLPGARLYLEPLIDLDRTVDAVPGLMDPMCNPRGAFHVVRCLNTVLFSNPPPEAGWTASAVRTPAATAFRLVCPRRAAVLVTALDPGAVGLGDVLEDIGPDAVVRGYDLRAGTVDTSPVRDLLDRYRCGGLSLPFLLDSTGV